LKNIIDIIEYVIESPAEHHKISANTREQLLIYWNHFLFFSLQNNAKRNRG
jgi:hypothetical protein